MSLFITFEGGEGCGKSTQAEILYRKLVHMGVPVVLTHEPGGTPIGEKATRLLKWAKDLDITPISELMLFNASRAQLVSNMIRPQLKDGKVVICDRFADSTIAYQGYGRGLDLETVRSVNRIATQGLTPDITVLLDIPVTEGIARKRSKKDRFEEQGTAFHEKVREGYLNLAAAEPRRWFVVNAMLGKKEISDLIWDKVRQLIPKPVK